MRVDLGFVGLGQIGSVMAERLLHADIRLHVFDPRAAAMAALVHAGALPAASPRAVADAATIIFASLPDRQVSLDVALGRDGIAGGSAVRQYVEMSTIGCATMAAIDAGLQAHGVGVVDAPVTGGVPGVRAGRLSIMVAGRGVDLDAVRPWLGRIGGRVTTLGPEPGKAQTMKLVCNLVVAANVIVACEGLAIGAKAGLDPGQMLELISSGAARSAASSDILPRAVLERRFDFGARTSIIDKDVRLGLAEAGTLGVPTPVIAAAAELWKAAGSETALADADFTAILTLVERLTGTRVGSTVDA